MITPQFRKVVNLEEQGWMLADPEAGKQKLLCGLPVLMRNLRRDFAYVYADASMRPVEHQAAIAIEEDFTFGGQFKKSSEQESMDHLDNIRNVFYKIFGQMV